MANERILHEPCGEDDVLTPAEADAIAAVFRRGAAQRASRYSMTLEDHRRLDADRPVTDQLNERLATPGSVIVPPTVPSASELRRVAARDYHQRRKAKAS